MINAKNLIVFVNANKLRDFIVWRFLCSTLKLLIAQLKAASGYEDRCRRPAKLYLHQSIIDFGNMLVHRLG
jgi:hypothetical protein